MASQQRGSGVELVAQDGGSGISTTVVPTEQLLSLVLLTFFFLSFLSIDLNCFVSRVLEDIGSHNARLQGSCHSLLLSYKGYMDLDCPVQSWRAAVHDFLEGYMQGWGRHLAESSRPRGQTSSGCVS